MQRNEKNKNMHARERELKKIEKIEKLKKLKNKRQNQYEIE